MDDGSSNEELWRRARKPSGGGSGWKSLDWFEALAWAGITVTLLAFLAFVLWACLWLEKHSCRFL